MERGSDQHGPRVDDAMATDADSVTRGAPVEARADEGREQESPNGSPVPPTDDLHERSELARHLRPKAFPADRDTLLRVSEEEHAPDSLLALLRLLPAGRTFDTVEAVWEALGGAVERRS
jgi:Protein of unknown function (DUF2795)